MADFRPLTIVMDFPEIIFMAVLASATKVQPRKKPSQASRLDDPEVGLMLRVQRDEPGAFAELIEHFGPLVFGRFYRQLNDRQEAEDLAQEVFLRLYRHRKRYQPSAKFATWLFHITQNVARNALRSRRRHPWVRLNWPAEDEPGGDRFFSRTCDPPSRPMERRELAGIVRTAVSGLAARQRTALELHQFHDLTYAEVAQKLDMTPKAAKSLLYRARNQLRDHLTQFMDPT
jgi:RNA polymerase sigma-70 factor (ECF subfamily)